MSFFGGSVCTMTYIRYAVLYVGHGTNKAILRKFPSFYYHPLMIHNDGMNLQLSHAVPYPKITFRSQFKQVLKAI